MHQERSDLEGKAGHGILEERAENLNRLVVEKVLGKNAE
jgi:hypothetical protein